MTLDPKRIPDLTPLPVDVLVKEDASIILSQDGQTYKCTPRKLASILNRAPTRDYGVSKRSLGIPLYDFPPSSFWTTAAGYGFPLLDLVVFTPDAVTPGAGGQGPGTVTDPAYVTATDAIIANGGRVLLYIRTRYTRRPLSDVIADIRTAFTLYPNIAGIFIDEVDTKAVSFPYYAQIRNFLNTMPANFLALNPGSSIESEIFMTIADAVMSFESNYSVWASGSGQPPLWVYNYPSHKFWCAIHTIPDSASMTIAKNLARKRNYGLCYFTDDVMDYPYNVIPSFMADEIAQLDDAGTDIWDLPGLCFYINADVANVTKDGSDLVSKAQDLSPIDHSPIAAGSARPLWVANQINGKAVFRFDGVNQYLAFDDAAFECDQPYTGFAVFKCLADDGIIFGSGQSSPAAPVGMYTSAGYLSFTAGNFVSTDLIPGTGYRCVIFTFGGYGGSIRRANMDGVDAVTFPDPGTYNWIKMGIGAYSEGNNKLTGDIATCGLFDRPLSIDDYSWLRSFLLNKYGH